MATKKQTIIQELIIKAPTRKSYDVGNWRTALSSADMGRMKQLYDLYEDLLIDGVLADAVDKRITAVTNSPLTFQDANGEEVQEMVDLIDNTDFEELLKAIMNRLFWGRSGGEFDFTDGFKFEPIPAKHISLESKSILLNDSDVSGISYEDDDHLLVLGKKHQFGLMLKTAPYAIWKRGGFGDYAQWLELFGMPQRVGKYSSYDPESRKLLEQALEQAGSAPYVVIPKESEVETTNNNSGSGSGSSYDDFRRACNEEILITLLGQTLTTVQGEKGARSLGEVHKEVEEGKNRSDMRYVQRVLNYVVLPLLEKRGFPVAGGRFFFPDAAEELTVADIVQLSDIMEIPAYFLHEKYSIPTPESGEPIARRISPVFSTPGGGVPPAGGGGGDEDEPVENSDTLWERVRSFFVSAPHSGASNGEHPTTEHGELVTPGHLLTEKQSHLLTKLNDADFHDRVIKHAIETGGFFPELFEWISADLIAALTEKSQKLADGELVTPGHLLTKENNAINLADIGFTYGYQSDAFRTAQELNVFQFSAAKSLAEVQRLNELYRETKSFDEFHKAASAELDVFNKTWQRTEHQTATLVTESAENYNRLRSKTGLFPYWEYRTVGDNKVRQEHRDLEGVTLPADDERWNQIWPPNGWKCRCYVVPRMRHEVNDSTIAESNSQTSAFFETTEWKNAKASGFGVNRAASSEVFAANQQYIRKFPNQASRLLKDVNYDTYGLKSYAMNRRNATTNLPLFDQQVDDFVRTLKRENDVPLLNDYKGRSIQLDAAAKGDRKLLRALAETVKQPDEVWINNTGSKAFDRFVSVKFYKDSVMVVVSEIRNGKVYRVAQFETAKEKGNRYQYRRGLLIKKPTP